MKKVFGKIFLFLGITMLFLSLFPYQKVNAQSLVPEFQHSISATYTILGDKSANATYNFRTTNIINNNYLTSFTLRLPFEPVEIVTDGSQNPVKIKNLKKLSDNNIYEVEIDFVKPIFGKDKAFDWLFSFKIKDLVLSHGMQNAIILPTFAKDISISNYNININIPKSLGQIRTVYGNAGIADTGNTYSVNFVASTNQASSVSVLLGPIQQYSFEIKSEEENENTVTLPENNTYQQTVYSEFPDRIFNIETSYRGNFFSIKKGEIISGIVSTDSNKDTIRSEGKVYEPGFASIKNKVEGLSMQNLTNKQKAEKIYLDLIANYSINNYSIAKDFALSLEESKLNVNVAEINQVYREMLGVAGIESRGVFGYVFPIQPFQRNEYFVEQHLWTEFWDGNEWISADPAWLISSRGTNYFDKNRFHHIKFGNYFEFDKLDDFFNTKRFLKIKPLSDASALSINEDLQIDFNSEVYLNKEVKLSIKNRSNFPIKLTNLNLKFDSEEIDFKRINIIEPIYIYPNSDLAFTLDLDYENSLFKRETKSELTVEYEDENQAVKERKIDTQIIIQSNLSSIISYIIIGGFIIIVLVSLFMISVYKSTHKHNLS